MYMFPIEHLKIHIYINNNIYIKYFSPLDQYDCTDVCTGTHPSSFNHINALKKNNEFKLHFFQIGWSHGSIVNLGQDMDVLMGSPRHYHLQNADYFLAPNFRDCITIAAIN